MGKGKNKLREGVRILREDDEVEKEIQAFSITHQSLLEADLSEEVTVNFESNRKKKNFTSQKWVDDDEIDEKSMIIGDLEEKLSRLRKKYSAKAQETTKLLGERELLKTQLWDSEKTKCELNSALWKIEELEKTHLEQQELLNHALSESAKAETKAKSLEVSRVELQHQLDSMTDLQGKTESKCKAMEGNLIDLKQQVKKLTELQVETEAKMKSMEIRLQSTIDHISGLNTDLLSLEDCQLLLSSSIDNTARLEKAVKRKMESFIESGRCVVCLVSLRAILILPCSHLILCGDCGSKLSSCPICRRLITSRVKVISS